MAKTIPVDFEKKVKQPPPMNGSGYPYQLSAKDLMKNFRYLLGLIPDGNISNDLLRWNGSEWEILTAPAATGTFVLGVVDGSMQWMATEEC